MSAPTTVVTYLPKKALEALIALGVVQVMLADAAFTPNQDTLDYVNDVTNEATGTSYAAGGIVLSGVVVNINTTTNTLTLDADNVTTAGLSVVCRWAIIYINTGPASNSPVIAYVDLSQGVGGNVTCTGIQWDANGIVPFAVA